jgi:hypothetical protein
VTESSDEEYEPLSRDEMLRMAKEAREAFSPDARAAMLRAARTDFSPQQTAELLRTIDIPSPSEVTETLDSIRANIKPGQVADLLRAVRVDLPAGGRGALLEMLRVDYSPTRIRNIGEAAPGIADWDPSLWNARVREAEEAAPPEPAEGWTLAGWLAALPLSNQLGLLTTALAAVEGLTEILESTGDVNRPESLQRTTLFMIAVMFFITALVAAREASSDE